MKKIKIKKLSLKRLFFGIVAISILPLAILSAMMFFFTPGSSGGVLYSVTVVVLGPILYGGIGVLFGLGYNWLSPRIGQFEMEIEIEDKTE